VNVPWSDAAGEAFGADWLLAALAPAGDFGRRARERERAFRAGDEAAARAALARVDRLARALDAGRLHALRDAIAAAPDPAPALVRAQNGDVLGDVDFFEIARFLDALATIAALATDDAFADVALPVPDAVLHATLAPGVTAARTFYLDDAFAAELARSRGESIARAAAFDAVRSALAERVARFAGIEHVRDGEFVLMRDRVPGPLPPEIRVVREALTYLLCEIALDDTALDALAARECAAAVVAEAEEGVRARLSADVSSSSGALLAACELAGELDLLVGRALVAQRYACCVPEVVNDATLGFESARYLPLAAELADRGLAYTPISLTLDGAAILTGPNMGGKTAALRTAGFIVACVALGLPVPAAAARVPLISEIVWLGLGLGTAAEREGLSAFGAEVVALRGFLDARTPRPLVLADEFARTTSPLEGRALLVALLQTLAERHTLALATTHFDGVAEGAGVAHFALGGLRDIGIGHGKLDLRAALARIAHAMDYRLARVESNAPAHSDALALAQALGLDETLVARARRALMT